MKIERQDFGKTSQGEKVVQYSLQNDKGMSVKVLNYGGIITSLLVPDHKGKLTDVVLGYDSVHKYEQDSAYIGALIGRYANRIAKGKFSIDGKKYTLAQNNGENHLHGGLRGFDQVIWQVEEISAPQSVALRLSYQSPDGEEGYPGNLQATVKYTLTSQNELKIDYQAQTDKATHVNLTNHSYFNLAGEQAENIYDHILTIYAKKFTPPNENLIPTGELQNLAGTALDFRVPQNIGDRIELVEGGYDHNFVLDKQPGENALAAEVFVPQTGIAMQVCTTQPGMQFYSGNFLEGKIPGKSGKPYPKHKAFCLETQHFPDSPNQKNFPTTLLLPGESYQHQTVFTFSLREI